MATDEVWSDGINCSALFSHANFMSSLNPPVFSLHCLPALCLSPYVTLREVEGGSGLCFEHDAWSGARASKCYVSEDFSVFYTELSPQEVAEEPPDYPLSIMKRPWHSGLSFLSSSGRVLKCPSLLTEGAPAQGLSLSSCLSTLGTAFKRPC